MIERRRPTRPRASPDPGGQSLRGRQRPAMNRPQGLSRPSAMVGTLGSAATRLSLVTANALSFPLFTCRRFAKILERHLAWPAIESLMAGPPPRYGTGCRRAGFCQNSGRRYPMNRSRRAQTRPCRGSCSVARSLANAVGRIPGICHQHVQCAHCNAQQIEVLLWIITEILEQRRIDGENADRANEERVAVDGRLLERSGAKRAVAPGGCR